MGRLKEPNSNTETYIEDEKHKGDARFGEEPRYNEHPSCPGVC